MCHLKNIIKDRGTSATGPFMVLTACVCVYACVRFVLLYVQHITRPPQLTAAVAFVNTNTHTHTNIHRLIEKVKYGA